MYLLIFLAYCTGLLWKAPELMKNTSRDPVGTQKGDVYAFALILYEMIGRKGPWGQNPYSNKGESSIISCVRLQQTRLTFIMNMFRVDILFTS